MMQKISIQLHADDIIYKPEDIAELEEDPPDQREAMVAAIMKEIGDLCKIGVFIRSNDLGPGSDKDDTPGPLPGPYSLVSLRSVPRILYILGIMGAKSNLPAPRTGGAATCVLISPRGVRRSPLCLWPRLLWHRHSKQQSHDPDDQS